MAPVAQPARAGIPLLATRLSLLTAVRARGTRQPLHAPGVEYCFIELGARICQPSVTMP
jgi:hypothetical protein